MHSRDWQVQQTAQECDRDQTAPPYYKDLMQSGVSGHSLEYRFGNANQISSHDAKVPIRNECASLSKRASAH